MSIRVHPWPILKVHTGTLAERPFELLEAFRYWSTIGASEADPRWINVPAGDRTDFASIQRPIPRILWPLLPPVGRSGKAAVIWLPGQIRRAIAA